MEPALYALWVGDHVALPVAEDGDPAEQPRLEAVVTLAHLAVLSKGRLTVGVGVGYVEPELTALAASLADRAARTDEHNSKQADGPGLPTEVGRTSELCSAEYLAAMRALWDEPVPSFAGVLQRPHPPIIVGGHAPRAYRLVIQPHTMDGTAVDELIATVGETLVGRV